MEGLDINDVAAKEQLASGLRQCFMGASAVATSMGFAGVAGHLDQLLSFAGPIATLLVFAYDQYKVRKATKRHLITTLPDTASVTEAQ